jgi:hypothetical protein
MDLIADRPDGETLGAAAMTYKVGRDLSQPSHRLTGRHRTQADSLDIRRILTCGYGFCRTGRTHGIDLRNRRPGPPTDDSNGDSNATNGIRQRKLKSGSGTVSVTFRDGLIGEEDAAAEQVGTGAAVHLAFEHFDAVDVPLDGAGAPGKA